MKPALLLGLLVYAWWWHRKPDVDAPEWWCEPWGEA
jgi:hypothetical protein